MRKILIANRGEIARRIIRTAHAMGIETVAVYSEADANAQHVREATQAVFIGPAVASESYLVIDKIIEAAQRTGADAIHPGYGFLSENATFAEACAGAHIAFIGPPPAAIRAMGLKDQAKKLMKIAGVPVVPGYQGDDQTLDRLTRAATAVGYPILIKAIAGGGGKGMRRVDAIQNFAAELRSCQGEADRSFGNAVVLLEKYVAEPRHVEIQIFADTHGNVVHLFERDCSVQRRHQKIIEEAPAPGLTDAMRTAMGVAACQAAKAIGYVGAGTVEFIVDTSQPDYSYYFMEMNTRLQVEHPVTEMITGLDLVEWQIRVARGERLPKLQDEITQTGHAIEVRLCAEDADSTFLPSVGTLKRLRLPSGVRVDSGVVEGDDITPWYDPMIAKIITHAPDRMSAIEKMLKALDETIVDGVKTNRAFLARVLGTDSFREARITTAFIDRHAVLLKPPEQVPARVYALAALAIITPHIRSDKKHHSPWSSLGGWRLNLPESRSVILSNPADAPVKITLTRDTNGYQIDGLGLPLSGHAKWCGETLLEADLDSQMIRSVLLVSDTQVEVRIWGQTFLLSRPDRQVSAASAMAENGEVMAPMPGRVLDVAVKPGHYVEVGDLLATMEAMKMEMRIAAPSAGTIKLVHVRTGQQISSGQLLIEIDIAEKR